MTVAFVQSITGSASGVSSLALTLASNVVAGRFLSGQYSIWNGGTPSNATPTGGGTWSTTTAAAIQGNAGAFVNYCPNATGGATTVTVNYGAGSYIEGAVAEFSGMASTPLDVQTSNSNAGSTTPTSGTTGATAQADELVLACLQVSASVTNVGIDPVSGYTNLRTQQDSNATVGHSSDYKILAATGTQSASWGTLAGSYAWSGKIATFKGAAGGGTAYTQSVAGALSSAGVVSKAVNRSLAGTLTSSGALHKLTSRSLAGTLTSSGAVAKAVTRAIAGTLSFAGALTANVVIKKALTAVLSFGGTLTTLLIHASSSTARRIRTLGLGLGVWH